MDDNDTYDTSELRHKAELLDKDIQQLVSEEAISLSTSEASSMLHELHVHEIELEIQNEELRRTQAELEISRSKYFFLYELAPVGYCTVNDQGIIVQANLTAAALFGVPRSTLLMQPFMRFMERTDRDIYYLHRRELLKTGEPQSYQFRIPRKDDLPLWIKANSIAADTRQAQPSLIHTALSDITESMHLHEALVEKNLALTNAKLLADKANNAKSDFISGMSHDLRTPLNAILGFAQLLDNGPKPLTPSQKRSTDQIITAGWYLLNLINEILDLSLIESGSLSLSLSLVQVQDVITECTCMVEQQAKNHSVTMTIVPPPTACNVMADTMRFKQVITNLLSNAIKYNRPGGTVTIDWELISFAHIRINIHDTGKGLSLTQIHELFKPFHRLADTKHEEQGTGIGLVVCKRLVESMGGEIGVESVVGTGSNFWFTLPCMKDSQIDTQNLKPFKEEKAHD